MNNLSGIVAIITSVLGATWYLSAQLSTMKAQIDDLRKDSESWAKQKELDTCVAAIRALHARVKTLEATAHR